MKNSIPSRFASFEIIRIVIPGMYFVSVVMLLMSAFDIQFFFPSDSTFKLFCYFIGSITAGLTFYAKETSKKRKAILSNQPSTYILNRSREISSAKPLTDDEARRLYFYILNHEMPMAVHDKVFFFGMIYHIMVNIRRTSFWFGLIGAAGLIIQMVIQRYATSGAITSVLLIIFIYVLNIRYNKADRKMQENYQDQIFWLEMNKELVDKLIHQRTQAS